MLCSNEGQRLECKFDFQFLILNQQVQHYASLFDISPSQSITLHMNKIFMEHQDIQNNLKLVKTLLTLPSQLSIPDTFIEIRRNLHSQQKQYQGLQKKHNFVSSEVKSLQLLSYQNNTLPLSCKGYTPKDFNSMLSGISSNKNTSQKKRNIALLNIVRKSKQQTENNENLNQNSSYPTDYRMQQIQQNNKYPFIKSEQNNENKQISSEISQKLDQSDNHWINQGTTATNRTQNLKSSYIGQNTNTIGSFRCNNNQAKTRQITPRTLQPITQDENHSVIVSAKENKNF